MIPNSWLVDSFKERIVKLQNISKKNKWKKGLRKNK